MEVDALAVDGLRNDAKTRQTPTNEQSLYTCRKEKIIHCTRCKKNKADVKILHSIPSVTCLIYRKILGYRRSRAMGGIPLKEPIAAM